MMLGTVPTKSSLCVNFDLCFETLIVSLESINPFHATGLFLYPLKTSEKQKFLLMFSGGIERVQLHDRGYYFSSTFSDTLVI